MFLLAVGLLATLPISIANASGSQAWYLTGDWYRGSEADDDTHHSDKIMVKTPPDNAFCRHKSIRTTRNSSWTGWWYAENAAVYDVAFQEGEWTVNLWYENSRGSGELYADVCSIHPDGTMTILATGAVSIDENCEQQSCCITCLDNPDTEQTILEGDRLAVRLRYEGTTSKGVIILYSSCGCFSRLTSPATDPGYPTPELPTVALMGMGLVGLVGYVGWSRKHTLWSQGAN